MKRVSTKSAPESGLVPVEIKRKIGWVVDDDQIWSNTHYGPVLVVKIHLLFVLLTPKEGTEKVKRREFGSKRTRYMVEGVEIEIVDGVVADY